MSTFAEVLRIVAGGIAFVLLVGGALAGKAVLAAARLSRLVSETAPATGPGTTDKENTNE